MAKGTICDIAVVYIYMYALVSDYFLTGMRIKKSSQVILWSFSPAEMEG